MLSLHLQQQPSGCHRTTGRRQHWGIQIGGNLSVTTESASQLRNEIPSRQYAKRDAPHNPLGLFLDATGISEVKVIHGLLENDLRGLTLPLHMDMDMHLHTDAPRQCQAVGANHGELSCVFCETTPDP